MNLRSAGTSTDSFGSNRLSKKQGLLLALLLLSVLISRFLTTEEYLAGIDSGNHLLAILDYSIADERPHPPGYPVYIAMYKAATWFTGTPHSGMLFIHIMFSVLAVYLTYRLAQQWLDASGALLVALFVATNPLFWLYGITTENYSWDAVFGVAAILVMLRAKGWGWVLAGLFFGLAEGMRGASLVLLAPVVLFIIYRRFKESSITWRDISLFVLGGVLGIAAWLPIVIVNEGGIQQYLKSSTDLHTDSAGPFYGNLASLLITLFWTLNLALAIPLIRREWVGRLNRKVFKQTSIGILFFWVVPATIFFALVIYAKGYGLLILPAGYILIVWLIRKVHSVGGRRMVTALVLAGNLLVFFVVPYISPPAFTAFAPRNRTMMQRVQSALGRATSVYLPSYQRMLVHDEQVQEALTMIRTAVPNPGDGSTIVIDPSAAQYIHARMLQPYLQEYYLFEPSVRKDSIVIFFHGIDRVKQKGHGSDYIGDPMVLLTLPSLIAQYNGLQGKTLASGKYFAAIRFTGEQHHTLRARIDSLYMRTGAGS